MSPEIEWKNAPEGTKSFVLTVYDKDAPTGLVWVHWEVVNIPANVSKLPLGVTDKSGLPNGALQTRTDLIPDGVSPLEVGNMDLIFNKIIEDKPMFEAGTQASYSPYFGYLVLGKILEATDPKKRKFAQIAQDELFTPLNMQSSSFGNAMNNPKRVLASHTEKMKQADSTLQNAQAVENLVNSMANDGWQVPAGNAFGTIDDVFAFAENLRLNLSGQGVRIVSPVMVRYATLNHCGDKDNLVFSPACQALGIEPLKANLGLHGGYVRGSGHQLSMCGFLASERSFGGLGGGTSYYLIDPERQLTVAFLSAGFIEGLPHLFSVAKMNDLIIGAC